MLKSRSTWPPGGWKFTEPKTGWSLPPGLSFTEAVRQITNHRLQNPRFGLQTDPDVVADELDAFTCRLLRQNPHWCAPEEPRSFQQPFSRTLPVVRRPAGEDPRLAPKGNVAVVSKFFKNTTAGIKLWIDWFGSGRPVEKVLAERRAQVCMACPLNEKANIAERFTSAAANEIMAIFSVLNDLDLRTPKDANLHVCSACDCPLKAKVWAPLSIIKKHITKEAWSALDKNCWMLSEQE